MNFAENTPSAQKPCSRKRLLKISRDAILLGLGLLFLAPVAWGADESNRQNTNWPQWRGPQRDGKVPRGDAWPAKLDADRLQQTWRIPLGSSYSGPIVSESLVFVTETKDKKTEIVRALDRASGVQRWETSWEGSHSVPFFAKSNGDWIRSTPAYDGECLFVGGIRDVLVCLDAESGEVRWRVDFVQELKTELPAFGFVSSPLVDGPHLYVQAGAAVCKLDKRTGKILWRALQDGGGMMGSAFSSPYLAEIAGRKQLLVQTREMLASLDPESGEVFWSRAIPTFRGMNILTPTVVGDSVFTSAYGGQSHLFRVAAGQNGLPSVTEAWTNRTRGYMSSPVVVDGHLYLHLQNQRFTCIDLASGETRWTSPPFGKYWSLVVNGDKILALDERGTLLLIQANPDKFELIDSREISAEETWAHLAVCGNEIFVRELNAMTAYRWQEPE